MRSLAPFVVALVLTVLPAGCGSDAPSDAAPADVPGEEVARGLCDALGAAADAETAEEDFARVHTDLHVVARAVEEVDRKAAAALLTAKQKVEDDLHRRAPESELAPDLRRLIDATAAGLRRLDVTVAPCDR
ncbi:MAG: hypothetical protein ACRD0C_07290 [Acidimicrobiia bacterium]